MDSRLECEPNLRSREPDAEPVSSPARWHMLNLRRQRPSSPCAGAHDDGAIGSAPNNASAIGSANIRPAEIGPAAHDAGIGSDKRSATHDDTAVRSAPNDNLSLKVYVARRADHVRGRAHLVC